VAFEFLAIGCLMHAATSQGWRVLLTAPPKSLRMDSWNRFPTYSFGHFGRRIRHSSIEQLSWVLMPRLFLRNPQGQELSIYYQGFPPKDVQGERPDWIIVAAKASVRSIDDYVSLKLEGSDTSWEGIYETLLGPYGPPKRHEEGTLPIPLGVIEVSLHKGKGYLNRQIRRYQRVYGAIKYAGFLGFDVDDSEFPVVRLDRSLNSKIALGECVRAGEELFRIFLQ